MGGKGGMFGRMHRVMARVHRDERGLIIGFFVRLVLVTALLALVIEEGGQMIVAQIHAEGAARSAAQAAANAYTAATKGGRGRDVALEDAATAASTAAQETDQKAHVQSVEVGGDGMATVTVTEVANTYVVRHIAFLRHLGVQHATDEETRST